MAVAIVVTPRVATAESQRAPGYLALTAGSAEVLGSDRVFIFGAEYRFRQHRYHIHPYLHGSWTSHGGGYLGAGLLYTFRFAPHWHVSLSSGPGYYKHGNFWKNLGHKLEFFSAIEISRGVGRDRYLGLRFGHISNAGFGHYNPGSETLELVYSFPLR